MKVELEEYKKVACPLNYPCLVKSRLKNNDSVWLLHNYGHGIHLQSGNYSEYVSMDTVELFDGKVILSND